MSPLSIFRQGTRVEMVGQPGVRGTVDCTSHNRFGALLVNVIPDGSSDVFPVYPEDVRALGLLELIAEAASDPA